MVESGIKLTRKRFMPNLVHIILLMNMAIGLDLFPNRKVNSEFYGFVNQQYLKILVQKDER